ncbi:Aste57867_22711 [Aphanomyces stellatus]|uniref:Aste57867_22711 protein n=1 Tax=Aphanomyces stellatus TaxID=120398 RepID=A0A485LKX6_9STRA|nr:hypothetical protein As57867_022641 [Aphanomyces stellatus]VFT99365.1 Aste57867_22711 [Aphanomyces stellatus]
MPNAGTCCFNGCVSPVQTAGTTKCFFHRHRVLCSIANCRNQVYARKRCIKHGGKIRCQMVGCSANARVGSLCSRHASSALKPACVVNGCDKQPRAHGRCAAHGGVKKCRVEGCRVNARSNQFCTKHSPNRATKEVVDDLPFSVLEEGHEDEFSMSLVLLTTSLEPWSTSAMPVTLDDECIEALGLFAALDL